MKWTKLLINFFFFAAYWWESFGGQCLQLQKFAIRVFNQTCNASGCEHNWSVFVCIHIKKRNHLEQKQLNDIVFMQYNFWLRHNQMMNKRPDLYPIVLEDIDPTSEWVEIEDPEFDVDFDIDMALGGDEADLVAPSAPGLVATSSKDKQPMEGTSCGTWRTRASIRSTSIVIGGSVTTKVANEAEASSNSDPNDVYVAPVDDPVSSSGDEFDDWSCEDL